MPVDLDLFRSIAGSFPTGVTIVTALEDGEPRGLTSNAVCSVSANPPLILVCVDKGSQTLPAIQTSGAWAVNFLKADRDELSNRFASKAPNKFEGVQWEPSTIAGGAPILVDDIVACAECVTVQSIDAGDHWIFIGSIEGGCAPGGSPLMYFRRVYSTWPNEQPA